MVALVPTPKKCEILEGENVDVLCGITAETEEWRSCCHIFAEAFDCNVRLSAEGGIRLLKKAGMGKGAYRIDCGDDGVVACASDREGILYAVSSLLQLAKVRGEKLSFPRMHLEDYPEKEYRSLMLDLSRQWHPFPQLLKYVDLCFLYKINYLHLHFVDNRYYTLPSREFPKLSTPGKHYSFEQIAQLNAYAGERGIILVPEYECPGHASVMVKKYPEIFKDHFEEMSSGDFYNESGNPINTDTLMCAGSEACIQANRAILKEISDMFPSSPYLHIGGDEANIKLWNHCSRCREYMREHQIEDVYELYSDFVARMAEYVFTLGKTPIVWEGFPKKGAGKIPRETIVIAWESCYNMPYDILEEGFRTINASWQPLYIVPNLKLRWNALDILKWNVYNWQNWNPISEAWLNPINVQPTDKVLGGILCAWESTYEQEVNSVMENLAALSERTWTVKRVCSDEEFLPKHRRLVKLAAELIQDR